MAFKERKLMGGRICRSKYFCCFRRRHDINNDLFMYTVDSIDRLRQIYGLNSVINDVTEDDIVSQQSDNPSVIIGSIKSNTPSWLSFEENDVISKTLFAEGETSCPICYDIYDEQERIPRLMPCGHVVCNVCLLSLAKSYHYTRIKCPQDRTFHIFKGRAVEGVLSMPDEISDDEDVLEIMGSVSDISTQIQDANDLSIHEDNLSNGSISGHHDNIVWNSTGIIPPVSYNNTLNSHGSSFVDNIGLPRRLLAESVTQNTYGDIHLHDGYVSDLSSSTTSSTVSHLSLFDRHDNGHVNGESVPKFVQNLWTLNPVFTDNGEHHDVCNSLDQFIYVGNHNARCDVELSPYFEPPPDYSTSSDES